MGIHKSTLATLPTALLYIRVPDPKNGIKGQAWSVPYINAKTSVHLPLIPATGEVDAYFTQNGVGSSWTCGMVNAIYDHRDLFEYAPIYWANVIGSVVYIIIMLDKYGTVPTLAVRYRHHAGELLAAYDRSLRFPSKKKLFLQLLQEKYSVVVLEKGHSGTHTGTHSRGNQSGHRSPFAPFGDLNKIGVNGARRRAIAAGLIPPEAEYAGK